MIGIEDASHHGDFLALFDDDALREAAKAFILAETQLDLGHVDSALMVRDHHGGEIAIWIAGVSKRHRAMHPRHRGIHRRREFVGPGNGRR